ASAVARHVADVQGIACRAMRRRNTQPFDDLGRTARGTRRLVVGGANQQLELIVALVAGVFVEWHARVFRVQVGQGDMETWRHGGGADTTTAAFVGGNAYL